MGKPRDDVMPFVFIYGAQSSGKTSVVKSLMSLLKVRHCYVDMRECYSNRVLFESILNELTGVTPSSTNKYTGHTRCDSLTGFVTELKSVLSRDRDIVDVEESSVIGEAGDTVYIVIDNAQMLRDSNETLLPALIRLPELTHSNLCMIFISVLSWDQFSFTTGIRPPFRLHFAQYSKDNVIKILSNNLSSQKYSSSFIINYSNMIYNIVSAVSRDLKDLLYISNIFFPLYCQPVDQRQVSESASRKLWSHIEPHFKAHISKLLLRNRSSEITINEILTDKQVTCRSSELLQFPVPIKYILISSYLASHNASSTDKRFFSKRKQKKRRHENLNKRKREEIKRYLSGPKSHPLDRLMAIYHSITEGDNCSSPNVFSQVETLVS
ncbi:PREDICTED: origin recognition complex subunit 5-like [Amphimedon queenslandica]|nr:PREDICTED: origin recognition complex subunit 5-like [Amphimedon queenslandica]|eukprot:XP_019853919.1 PREDICTED: origin recognition complex subunit 5-like [Amphimedon queenslandica]